MSCKTVVMILGAPHELCRKLEGSDRSLKNGRRELLLFELGEHQVYTPTYLQDAYVGLSKFLQGLRENRSGRMLLPEKFEGVLIYYFRKENFSLVEQKFFPEVLCRAIEFDLKELRRGIPKNKFLRRVNPLVNTLVSNINKDEKLLSTLKQELSSNANTTPMLLPVKNFPTLGLGKISNELNNIEIDKNLNAQIRGIVKKLDRFFPKVKVQNRRVFLSEKKVLFKSPGKDRHGYPEHDNSDHATSCWVKGNFRFGAAFDSRFHYDCTRRHISEKYFLNCCEQKNFQLSKSKSYVNVYVNDNLR